jgi:hypothetical protein
METQFRPFSLACSLTGGEADGSGITLRDGAGTQMLIPTSELLQKFQPPTAYLNLVKAPHQEL